MEFKGRYALPANPATVWAALNDPQVLGACLPGSEGVEKISEHEFKTAAAVKIGQVKTRLTGGIVVSEADPPRGCKLTAQGQGVAGFLKGTAILRMVPSGETTIVDFTARITASGRLAQAGARALDTAAKLIADAFFAKLTELLANEMPAPAHIPHDHTAMVPPSHTRPGPVHSAAQTADSLAPQIWVAGLVAVVVIVLILFGMVL